MQVFLRAVPWEFLTGARSCEVLRRRLFDSGACDDAYACCGVAGAVANRKSCGKLRCVSVQDVEEVTHFINVEMAI